MNTNPSAGAMPVWRWLAGAALLALIASCGGGSGGGSPPVPAPVAPALTAQPASLTVQAGQAASFSVVASGDAPLAYQWLRDNNAIAGAVQSSYTLASPTIADSNSRFAVRISNAAGAVTSNEAVLTVTPKAVVTAPGISILAGTPGGTGNVDGTGTSAYFSIPQSLTFDAAGNLYIADERTIRVATPDGRVSTVAGVADAASEIRDGTGNQARFGQARAIAAAPDGSLYIVDANAIRRMTAAGAVSTVVGAVTGLTTVGVAPNGDVFFATRSALYKLVPGAPAAIFAGQERGVGTGPPVTQAVDGTGTAAVFTEISDLAIDAAGNIYVSELFGGNIRKITPAASVTTLARITVPEAVGFNMPDALAVDPEGNLWVFELSSGIMHKVAPNGAVTTPYGAKRLTPAGTAAQLDGDMAFSPNGELYFSYQTGVSRLSADGAKTVFVGSLAPSTSEYAPRALGLKLDAAGNVVAPFHVGADLLVRRVAPNGDPLPELRVAMPFSQGSSRFGNVTGMALDSQGAVITGHIVFKSIGFGEIPSGGEIVKTSPSGEVTRLLAWPSDSAGAMAPAHLTLAADGSLHFLDLISGNLMRWASAGSPTVVASLGAPQSLNNASMAIAFDAAGRLHVLLNAALYRVTGNALVLVAGAAGQSGTQDGAGASARFSAHAAVGNMAGDASGNLLLVDGEVIRKISPDGVVSTVAGQRGKLGVQPGPLPGTLGANSGAIAAGPDGALYLQSSQALVKINLQ